MTRLRGALRRRRLAALAVLTGLAALTYSLVAGAATPIPVPDPLVVVTTKSGTVTKTHYVPIGGAPVPIDVDGQPITGLIEPDIDVSVGLVSVPELPGKPVVPNVVVRRNALALATDRPAPPLDIDARVVLRDANDGLKPLVEVHYGFATPPGARIPPVVEARLVGPVQGGFVDPLQAKILSPGYSGPLNFKISALTEDLDAKFALNFDALPESIFVSQDPREDGLDVLYTHSAPVADVHLDAFATLRNRQTDELLEVGATIERLPQRIELSNTNTADATHVTYDSSSALNKPDVEAVYRDRDGDGKLITDVNAKVAGLPFSMQGTIGTVPTDDGGSKLDSVDFEVLEGEEIESIDFLVRNWEGPAGPVPAPKLAPLQHIAVGQRFVDGETRMRAAGRILGIRSATFDLQGPKNDIVDATTDIGNGAEPLRAVVDIDDRPDPSVADDKDQRLKVDTTLSPLPENIHFRYEPSPTPADPLRLLYESSRSMDVDATATIATNAADGCGFAEVTCVKARVDDVPRTLEALLPGRDGTDFSISNDAEPGHQPDARAVVDATGEKGDRTYAEVALLRLPAEMRGRVDTTEKGVLRKAEFHACSWDFDARSCTDAQGAIGRVDFTVRDHPQRGNLPPRPATGPQFVAMVSRNPTLPDNGDERFEATGSVKEVRHVAFHQRDDADDGKPDGTIGVNVAVSAPKTPFDIALDTVGRAHEPADETVDMGETGTRLDVHIPELPSNIDACFRENAAAAPKPPSELSEDPLLAQCDRRDVLRRSDGQLDTTPMSIHYKASASMVVEAKLDAYAPDAKDRDDDGVARPHSTVLDTKIDRVPAEVRVDMIPGAVPQANPPAPGRKLELAYQARDAEGDPAWIDTIALRRLESRRTSDVCGDPRPKRMATCMDGTVHDLPSDIYASFDPDETKGDLEFSTSVPLPGRDRPSIDPLHLQSVSPTSQTPLIATAAIKGLTPRLSGRIKNLELDPEPGLELAELRLNGCVDEQGDERCDGSAPFGHGIESIDFDVTNAFIGQGLPGISQPAGTEDWVGFVARGKRHHAQGKISALREVLVSRLHPQDDTKILESTRIRAGFGPDSPSASIKAFADIADASGRRLMDVELEQPPKAFEVCLRDPVPNAKVAQSHPVWCETQAGAKRAIRVGVELPGSGRKPDVDVKRLLLENATGSEVLTGNARIENLGRFIDVLAAGDPREEGADVQSCENGQDDDGDGQADASDPDCRPGQPDVLIEGKDDAGQVANIAGRVTAKIQNFKNGEDGPVGPPQGATDFPWAPYEGRKTPLQDDRNQDPGGGDDPGGINHVSAVADIDGRFLVDASVPDVRRLGVRPGPCYTDDRVRKASEFPLQFQPQYTCARVHAAPGSPLGLSFRTLKNPEVPPPPGQVADPRVMAVEEGHITQMPTGDKGFEATIAALPKTLESAPLCGADEPAPCRPPLVSVENDRGAGQTADHVTLEAGVAMGPMSLLGKLAPVQGLDDASKRLDYEEPTKAWPAAAKGARLKIGTKDKDSAVRLRVKLGLPRFLDFYPPQTWSCKSKDKNATEQEECDDASVSSDSNEGFASTDIFLKLVGADTKHDGVGHRYLGRVAALFQPFSGDGDQIVITGAPEPDGKDIFNEPVTGASSTSPETVNALPTGDPSFWGARLPGHLDVRIQMRNDYHATKDLTALGIGDFENQQHYTQIDGRINRPMTMQLRLNDKLVDTREGDHRVSAMSLTAANLASTNDQDSFSEPSFRVRSELTPSYSGGTWLDDLKIIPAIKAVMALIEFLDKTKDFSPVYVSPVFPEHTEVGWLDVKLNADPTTPDNEQTSAEAARTVEAVAGPFGALNQAELRGWKSIHGFGDEHFARNDGAKITPQAALHLYDFDLGAEVGVSLYGLAAVGVQLTDVLDMVMGVSGNASKRVKLEQVLSSLALYGDGEGGEAIIDVDAISQLGIRFTISLLWGLIDIDFPQIKVGDIPQQVGYLDCSSFGGPMGRATSSEIDEAALLLGFPDWNQLEGVDDAAAATIGTAVAVVTQLISPISCLLHAFYDGNDNLISGRHPAPRYEVVGHPIEGTDEADDAPPTQTDPGVGNPATTPPQDITIHDGETKVYCGVLVVGNLVVEDGGQLLVGEEGQADPNNPGKTCDGSLQIGATNVTVHSGGLINASARRSSLIPVPGGGETRGSGGGDGGDRSDIGGWAGGDGGGIRDEDEQPPLIDFGAPGEDGGNGAGGDGGRGGGALIISANENIVINGHVRSDGEAGGPEDGYPEACLARGGGGGAGGGIEMSALRVIGGGEVTANGGRGGDSSESGGGGSGGHITINTIVDDMPETTADGGEEGDADHEDGDCNDEGDSGDDGEDDEGEVFGAAAFVTLHPDTPGPVQGSDQVKLNIRAIQDGGGDAMVVVCRNSGPPELEGGLQSSQLDPPEDASALSAVFGADQCHVKEFEDPTHGGDEYRATLTVPAPNGWHGYFGVVDIFQDVAPQNATALIGVDRSGPFIESDPPFEGNGVAGCPGNTYCLNVPTAVLGATLKDPMSGVFATRCRVDGGPWNDNCSTGKTHTVAVDPDKQGVQEIDMEMADRVGNTSINVLEGGGTQTPLARFFIDTARPTTPQVDISYSDGGGVNGWHTVTPTITASTSDPNPSAGFAEDPITVYVSGDDNPCGAQAAGSTSTSGSIGASCAANEIDVPDAGIHEVVARAVDRAGNVSQLTAKQEIRVDKTPPTSEMSLTPRDPDGKAGWYRTRPLFTFAAEDNPDGSGIDLAKHPSRIEYQLDGGAWHVYDPESEDNYIPEGEHDICWKAWDVAGNEQTTPSCVNDIRVDATAPTVADGLSPQSPTGDNSYYASTPTVDPVASNPLPPNVNLRSPIDKVELQVDGGDWKLATQTPIAEGEHVVRARAFDVAGNPSAIVERRILVDKTGPSARLVSFPPRPNDHGWFRRTVQDAVAARDGRDGSGEDGATYQVDAEGPISYLTPFTVFDGDHVVKVQARDLAGLKGPVDSRQQRVDTVAPSGAPVGKTPTMLLPALGLPTAVPLRFTAGDQHTPRVRVRVFVYDALGNVVRRIDAPGPYAGGYRDPGQSQVSFNGRKDNGQGVVPGVYHYRVHVTDQAGNTVLSDESPPFLVVLGVLPL